MDNLTHALVGAAISKAGAERATPLATATLVVAANAPDVDMLAFLGGPYAALAFRRGITHGLPAMLVLSFAVTGAMLAWDRLVRRRRDPGASPARAGPTLGLSAVGLLTHPTLDWMNTYGMRWWLPLSGSWSYGDALFIIDPWIWLALGGAVHLASGSTWTVRALWALLAALATAVVAYGTGATTTGLWLLGLVVVAGARMRRRGAPPAGARVPAAALAAVSAYILLMAVADVVASAQTRAAADAAGLVAEDVMVAPSPANPFRADIEIRTPDAYVPGVHRWFGGPRVELRPERAVPRVSAPVGMTAATAVAVIATARARPVVRDYLVWSRYPVVHITEAEDGWNVRYADARYDDRREAGSLGGVTVQITNAEIR